jgi:hypothetical protein
VITAAAVLGGWLRRIEQRGDLSLGQLLSAHRSCSPEVLHRQTSRSELVLRSKQMIHRDPDR